MSHKIGWLNRPGTTGETWNPIIGCSKISAGCANCYAEKMAKRLASIKSTKYYRAVLDVDEFEPLNWRIDAGWNWKTAFVPAQLEKPLRWKTPRTVFVCSMGDLFHESVSPDWLYEVFDVMSLSPKHTFIVLTKRPKQMRSFVEHSWLDRGNEFLPNVWMGVTAENQEQADARIPYLLATPAAVRFVSIEPMLGPLRLEPYLEKLDWVLCGCESGPGRRLMKWSWAEDLLKQCKANVPFFMKQLSKGSPAPLGKVAKEIDEFPPELRVREFPNVTGDLPGKGD